MLFDNELSDPNVRNQIILVWRFNRGAIFRAELKKVKGPFVGARKFRGAIFFYSIFFAFWETAKQFLYEPFSLRGEAFWGREVGSRIFLREILHFLKRNT